MPILSLVHESSSQSQKIQASHSICVTYRQHLTNLIKVFEELLQASEVDYYVAEGFREQLNQSVQLFERLEKQCLYGGCLWRLPNYLPVHISANGLARS